MLFSTIFYVFVCLSSTVIAQSSPAVPIAVPTGTPVPGNYTGRYRPQVHFSPPAGFMNDPNGMHRDANGTFHLYYQYNPTALVAGNQHWGHATSTDLYHWINQPIALFPPDNTSGIFSGSAVIDVNNTSGFFPNQDNGVVAIYTLNTPQNQTQNIAISFDSGCSFIPFANNPVIDSNSTQFRDPYVIRYQDHWAMVVAFSQDFVIGIYTSPDLINWEHASNFSHVGLLGLQYECPNLVEVPVNGTDEIMFILAISINPGAPLGGSITQYFPGHFNGTHFTAVDAAARIADFGKDNYAGQWFHGIASGQNAVSIAWASNWQYANVVPTADEGWRSPMSLPRQNFLINSTRVGWDLVSIPYDLTPILGSQLLGPSSIINDNVTIDYANVSSNAIYFQANLSLPAGTTTVTPLASFNFSFSSVSGEVFKGGYFYGGDNAGAIWLNRGGLNGFEDNPFFNDKFSFTQDRLAHSISGLIDRSIFEIFLDDGERSATSIFFSNEPLTIFNISSAEIESNVQIWAVASAWERFEDSDGVVVGNVTTSGGGS